MNIRKDNFVWQYALMEELTFIQYKTHIMKRILLFGFLFLMLAAVVISCQKELSLETDQNLARGTLYDSLGDCNPIVPSGTYYNGVTANRDTNFVKVAVTVTQTGSYTLSTGYENGFGFSDTGYFSKLGVDTILLHAFGKPTLNIPTDFTLAFDSSICGFTVNVQDSTGTGLGTVDTSGTGGGIVSDSSYVDPNPAATNTWHFTDTATGVTYSGVFTALEGAGFRNDTLFVAGQASVIDTVFGVTIKIPSLTIAPQIYPVTASNTITLQTFADGNKFYTANDATATDAVGNSYITITSYSGNQLAASFHAYAEFNGVSTLIEGSFNCLVQ